jgi:hypothetical protein
MGKQCSQISSSFFRLVTFSYLSQYSTQAENCGFSQWVDPPAIDPYVNRLPRGCHHLQPEAGAVGGIGFSRSIVWRRRRLVLQMFDLHL